MKTAPCRPRDDKGWVFIAVLVMVTAASIIGLALTLVWVRYHRMVARHAEKQELVQLANAYRAHVMQSTAIPHPTSFVQVVRSRVEKPHAAIQMNRQGNPRIIIEDPDVGVGPGGTNKLPFAQGQHGSRVTSSPRLLIISSLGRPLPNLVTGAALTSEQFNNLWNAARGQIPAGWNWDGNPDDLLIERVQAGDLFVSVTLRYYQDTPPHRGLYLVSSDPVSTNLPSLLPTTPLTNSFLRGTYLSLHGTNGALQFREILQESGLTYTCQDGMWRLGQGVRGNRIGPVVRHPTPEEFADALGAFLDMGVAVWPDNTSATKQDMVRAITNFLAMGAYDNQSAQMSAAQSALIDAWVAFTGAQINKP
jgi:hypothetical protein